MSTDIERELERTIQQRGFRFGMHDFLAHVGGAELLKKHNDRVEDIWKGTLIDRKTREMAIIAACVALKDSVAHLQVHMHAAHQAGATPEEIMELVNIVGEQAGAVARINGLEVWRVTFRPDIPTINRVVELR